MGMEAEILLRQNKQLSSRMNHNCLFLKAKFYWLVMLGKELERDCSGNLGPVLRSGLAQDSRYQNSPCLFSVLALHGNRTNKDI
jgi:hypothetical protein